MEAKSDPGGIEVQPICFFFRRKGGKSRPTGVFEREEQFLPMKDWRVWALPVIGTHDTATSQVDSSRFRKRGMWIGIELWVAQERDRELVDVEFQQVPVNFRKRRGRCSLNGSRQRRWDSSPISGASDVHGGRQALSEAKAFD